jgi:hypothetical protein
MRGKGLLGGLVIVCLYTALLPKKQALQNGAGTHSRNTYYTDTTRPQGCRYGGNCFVDHGAPDEKTKDSQTL